MPAVKETGEKIFQTALELFRTRGFENATMRDIAQAAGVATGAAYYYYPSKDAIADIAWFRRILTGSGIRVPGDVMSALPGMLWFFQMGIVFFWVIDDSPEQRRTSELLRLAARAVARLVQLSTLPFLRPVRKTSPQIAQIVSEAV